MTLQQLQQNIDAPEIALWQALLSIEEEERKRSELTNRAESGIANRKRQKR